MRVADQPVGRAVLQGLSTHFDDMPSRGGKITQQRVVVRGRNQHRQVSGAGLVLAGQPRGLDIAGVFHAQLHGLGVHQAHEGRHPTGIGTPQGMGGAVLARHQRQMQHLAPAQGGTDLESRGAALFGVHIVLGDGDRFIEVQLGLAHDQAGHELGDRGDGQDGVIVLAQEHLLGVLVDHVSHAGLQGQLIGNRMQTSQLAKRRAWCHLVTDFAGFDRGL